MFSPTTLSWSIEFSKPARDPKKVELRKKKGKNSPKFLRNYNEICPEAFLWSFKIHRFRSCIQVFDPSSVNFCIWCKVRVQFYSFACRYLVFPQPFVENVFFSMEWSWLPYQESFDYNCEFISGLSILFPCSVCIYENTTLLITV